MAFLSSQNFRVHRQITKNADEYKRPDSPTIMLTKHTSRRQLLLESSVSLVKTFKTCNPRFLFDPEDNPARALTKPSEPVHNDSYDNADFNYLLYVNQKLVSPEGEKYTIIDSLGEGTFGQVVKCRTSNGSLCAAKVIKNKPAYYIQGLIEVKILSKINKELDPQDTGHIVRMIDFFVFRNHLIIIFELLSLNIFELIKKNKMRGLSLSLIRSFTKQMLEALCVLEKGNIIHCDMKPENILLVNDRADIKIIDLGSACFENSTIYTYLQSRYYRSPEVLIGLPYGSEIDAWSLGCICVELFIGIPLFPGSNEFDQLFRITKLLGDLPQNLVTEGKFRDKFYVNDTGFFRLKTREEYMQTQNITLAPYRTYVDISSLDDFLDLDRRVNEDIDIESRKPFIDFLKGLLKIDPGERWTASQAMLHPFIQGGDCKDFFPAKSKEYIEIIKNRAAPAGNLRSSCPLLLQRIRESQDMTVTTKDVCYRPVVEDLNDEFFTGFVHNKLIEMQKPVQTNWNNPMVNMPLVIEKPQASRPAADIVGPRYNRPHSYEDHNQPPRPISPMIEQNIGPDKKFNKQKYWKKNEKIRQTKKYEFDRKFGTDQIRQEEKPHKNPSICNDDGKKICHTKTVDSSSGFLSKVMKEASEKVIKDS